MNHADYARVEWLIHWTEELEVILRPVDQKIELKLGRMSFVKATLRDAIDAAIEATDV
jgi:hypothetical protein